MNLETSCYTNIEGRKVTVRTELGFGITLVVESVDILTKDTMLIQSTTDRKYKVDLRTDKVIL